jgi:hypothetical protein
MTPEMIKDYESRLSQLTGNEFERNLLDASLKNLTDKENRLRFNNFACGIRELSRHILHRLSPDKEVVKCNWYENQSQKPNQLTRGERIKYSIQKGLPDKFVETFFDAEDDIKKILDTLDQLSKYIHVNPDTFGISEQRVNELSAEVLSIFERFANGISEFHESLKNELEQHIDQAVLEHSIQETFDKIDILATHHNIEEHETSSYEVVTISSQKIDIVASGTLSVRLQYGSDHDLDKGDGAEMYESFPFECQMEMTIDIDFSKSKCEMLDFDVDTSGWYE